MSRDPFDASSTCWEEEDADHNTTNQSSRSGYGSKEDQPRSS